jgi:flagellar biosynthetic protein FliR
MLAEVLSFNVFALLLVVTRVGALFMLLPGFSAPYVSIRIRLMLAVAVSLALLPLLAERLPALPAEPAGLAVLLLGETVIGVFLGTVARVLFAGLHAAGTFASFFMSLANALSNDAVAESQASTVAGLFGTLGMVLVFVTDLHHVLLRAVAGSYALLPAGQPLPVGDLAETLGRALAESFVLALQMAAPFLVLAFTYHLGVGLLSRLMPQLPVFFFGLPIQISLQIWVLMLTLSAVLLAFLGRFAETMAMFAGG